MPKKNIKVKKDNHDISITIENNLNANNKQINHDPIKRRRRKKKVENNDEIDTLEELPTLTDTSYIKPGPVGAFQMLRPAQPGAGVGAGAQEISFDNFQRFLAMLMENQRNGNPANNVRPPPAWGRGLVDDDDDEPADNYSFIRPPPQPEDDDPVDDEPVIIPPPQPARTDSVSSVPLAYVDSLIPPPTPTRTDSDIFSLSSSDVTDDDVQTLLPKRIFPRGGTTSPPESLRNYEIKWGGPPKRPPPPSAVVKQLLEKLPADKAAKMNLIYDLVKQNLIGELEAGPRRNTESLEAGPLMRD
jgi:hypothetical protein